LSPCDPFAGAPFTIPGDPTLRDFLIQRAFSRFFLYGGSASYTVPSLDFPGADLLNGDIFHFSAAYTPHNAYWTLASVLGTARPTKIGEINMTLDGERYVRWSQKFPSMYLLGEYNYKSRSTPVTDIYVPAMGHKGINTVVLSLTQFFPNNIWGTSIEAVCDTNQGGNWFMQPSITYKPTSNQEYNVYWNFEEGTVLNVATKVGSKVGELKYIDAIYFRAVYKM
jgi:hypothetical protein